MASINLAKVIILALLLASEAISFMEAAAAAVQSNNNNEEGPMMESYFLEQVRAKRCRPCCCCDCNCPPPTPNCCGPRCLCAINTCPPKPKAAWDSFCIVWPVLNCKDLVALHGLHVKSYCSLSKLILDINFRSRAKTYGFHLFQYLKNFFFLRQANGT